MTENLNLKQLEKKTWKSYFQDGIWDLFLGLLWLGLGISPLLEKIDIPSILGYVVMMVPAYIVFVAGKRYITTPRMGLVKFSPARKSKTKNARIALTASVLFGIIVMLLVVTDVVELTSDAQFGAIAFCVNAIVVFSILAYFLDFNRLYLYGLMFASSIVLVELLRGHVESPYHVLMGFGVPGAIVAIIGAVYLIRFILAYPLPVKEVSNAG